MDIKIRKATLADADTVAKITYYGWKPIYDGYKEALGEEIYETAFGGALEAKMEKMKEVVAEGRVYVAEEDGIICAFASYMIEGKVGALKENSVHPNYKGRGIAGMLHRTLLDLFRENGCTVARVMTGLDDAHAPARRAYEKLGFSRNTSSVTYFMEI